MPFDAVPIHVTGHMYSQGTPQRYGHGPLMLSLRPKWQVERFPVCSQGHDIYILSTPSHKKCNRANKKRAINLTDFVFVTQ